MRIVLDMQGAQTNSRFRGIGRYTVSMAQALLRIESKHEIFLAFNASMPEAIADVRMQLGDLIKEENVLIWYGPGSVQNDDNNNDYRRRVAEECFKTFLQQVQTDLLFVSSYFESFSESAVTCVAEPAFGYATCVVVYDLIPLLNQEHYLFHPVYAANYKRKLNELQRAAAALTISEFSRTEALQHLSFTPNQIVNTYLGAESKFQPRVIDAIKRQQLMQTFKLDRPFLLYAGGSDERKNLPRLINAFSVLPEPMRQSYQLLFAGKFSAADQAHLQGLTHAHGLEAASVCFTGYISDDTLIDLYNLCTLFVFPSWHEGFGLPVLEAMACGAPAIAANCSSLPEVLADPAAMFNPLDVDDISRTIAEVLGHEDLRQSLIERGTQHVKSFSWEKSASIAMAKFEQLLAEQPKRAPLSGSELNHSLRTQYLHLIERIAALSVSHGSVHEQDLKELACCIDRNQSEALRVCSIVQLPNQSRWSLDQSLIAELAPALDGLGQHVMGQYPLDSYNGHALQAYVADVIISKPHHLDPTVLPTQVQIVYGVRLLHTVVAEQWVLDLNQYVRGAVVSSHFMRKLLIDAGVYVPIVVERESIAAWIALPPAKEILSPGKRYRFVCEVSDIERDGFDVLLHAYAQSFCASDEVSLLVLVEPAFAIVVGAYIDAWRAGGTERADIVMVTTPDDAIRKAIYLQSHCFVLPSRFQDVSTVVRRAVALKLPVITTGWGAQADVEIETESFKRIDYIDYRFERCLKEPSLFNDYWAEPDQKKLSSLLLAQFSTAGSNALAVTTSPRAIVPASPPAVTLNRLAREWSSGPTVRPLRIGWITTWNVRCGIAAYSEHLTDCISEDVIILAPRMAERLAPDCDNVVRCWDHTDLQLDDLNAAIKSHGIDTLVVQFNYGFFEFGAIAEFLNTQAARGVNVVMTMHATVDPTNAPDRRLSLLVPALRTCHRILVHSVRDMDRLKHIGLSDNVTLFPLGVKEVSGQDSGTTSQERRSRDAHDFTIASYGFFLPHKGLLELIDAVALLRSKGHKVVLNMFNAEYPNSDSQQLVQQAILKIQALGLTKFVTLRTDFLSDKESLSQLKQSDLVVYPYQETGESASAAVRFGLAAMTPVAVTPLAIFDDVSQAVFRLPGFTAEHIAEGVSILIEGLRSNSEETISTLGHAKAWTQAHQFSKLAVRLLGILKARK
jgi:glycosyltransferase involved in cell wall biosynthesis